MKVLLYRYNRERRVKVRIKVTLMNVVIRVLVREREQVGREEKRRLRKKVIVSKR